MGGRLIRGKRGPLHHAGTDSGGAALNFLDHCIVGRRRANRSPRIRT